MTKAPLALLAEEHWPEAHPASAAVRTALQQSVAGNATGTVLVGVGGRLLQIEEFVSPEQPDHHPSRTTAYDLASIGKTFTAVLALHLSDQGRFDLDAPLRSYLPELPESMADITARTALSHSAALPRYLEGDDLTPRTAGQALAEISRMERERSAGQYYYSNVGPTLVALAIERAAGQPFAELLRSRIFKPLGMRHAYLHGDSLLAADKTAPGYANGERRGSPAEWPQTWTMLGSGGIAASVEDLWKFNRAVFAGSFLSPKSKGELLAEGVSTGGRGPFKTEDTLDITYGHGLYHWQDRQGRRIHFHGGGSDFGSNTGMFWRQDDDTFIAILLNSASDEFEREEFYSSVLQALSSP
jgi:CubicO group peptidase (beta-lactamase class C family)